MYWTGTVYDWFSLICIHRKPHQDIFGARFFNHFEYDTETLEFDISLVKIKKVQLTSHIQPISLPVALDCNDREKTKNGKRKRRRKRKGKGVVKRKKKRKRKRKGVKRKRGKRKKKGGRGRSVKESSEEGDRKTKKARSERGRDEKQMEETKLLLEKMNRVTARLEEKLAKFKREGKDFDRCNIEQNEKWRQFWYVSYIVHVFHRVHMFIMPIQRQ